MIFDLENLLERSLEKASDFVKYGMQPYPAYFQTYDWKAAERDADDCIKSDRVIIADSIEAIQADLRKMI